MMKTSSMFSLSKILVILKAKSKEGLYLAFSNALIVCLVTPVKSANFCWLNPFSLRNSLILVSKKSPKFFLYLVKNNLLIYISILYYKFNHQPASENG